MSPESRVLLAPIPKTKPVRKKAHPNNAESTDKPGVSGPAATSEQSASSAVKTQATEPSQVVPPQAPRPSAQAQSATLDAIRAKLVESAQKAGVRVRSLAWLDEKGQLYESNRFDSLAKVRGIRVNEYLGETSVDVNDVSAEALPQDCGPEATKFLRHAYFKVYAGKGGEYFSGHQLQVMAQALDPDFKKLLLHYLFIFGVMVLFVFIYGPMKVFVLLHESFFPANHQWFFYYQDSLMTTMMKAPDLFFYIAGAWVGLALLIFFLLAYLLARFFSELKNK
jgi:hypothetical protein